MGRIVKISDVLDFIHATFKFILKHITSATFMLQVYTYPEFWDFWKLWPCFSLKLQGSVVVLVGRNSRRRGTVSHTTPCFYSDWAFTVRHNVPSFTSLQSCDFSRSKQRPQPWLPALKSTWRTNSCSSFVIFSTTCFVFIPAAFICKLFLKLC